MESTKMICNDFESFEVNSHTIIIHFYALLHMDAFFNPETTFSLTDITCMENYRWFVVHGQKYIFCSTLMRWRSTSNSIKG